MSSIIEGYNYDIFISYRQKDNKHDGWISEFVNNLKGELESTFKEEISVYFDINPHDGLLETHDVDASLKDKLKCLVFIPIISRTYCDPKSFAWEHEFKAFVEQASKDQFGLKVKLSNGNVASRVLPVRIHDLDKDDIKLCESVLGGVLRGVEFIYREPGVNRSLTSGDDEKKNLNNTKYRNQVNKVALAIREIISGLRAGNIVSKKEKTDSAMPWEGVKKDKRFKGKQKPLRFNKFKLLSGIMSALILLVLLGVFIYPKIFKVDQLRNLRTSDGRITLAVIPFQNLSNDSTLNYLKEWLPESIVSYLSNFSEDLQVRQPESIYSLPESKTLTNNASITPSAAALISQKLDANIIISGSIAKAGTGIIVDANLINSKTEEVLKSFREDGNSDEIIQKIDTLSQKIKNYLIISKLKKGLSPDAQLYVVTGSPEALRHYILGVDANRNEDYGKAAKEYLKAIRIDSNFINASINLIDIYKNLGFYDSAKILCLRLYGRRDQLKSQLKLRTEYAYSTLFKMPYDCIKYLKQLLELDDQQPEMYYNLGYWYNEVNQQNKAIAEAEKSLEIYKKWDIKPPTADNYTFLIDAYHDTKQKKKEERLIKQGAQDYPDNLGINWCEFRHSLDVKDTLAANDYREKIINLYRENSEPELNYTLYFAYTYRNEKYPKKAEEYIQKAFTMVDNDPVKINNLAWFLIIEDVNINEGLELADKALEISPNNYALLDTKGWGLYKQGKYKEALNFIQKADSLKPTSYESLIFFHIQEVKKAIANQK
jgi:tetratricopeptide (TPR) repeat protein